jgi:hypothetical protein
MIGVRAGTKMIAAIDAWAKARSISRSEAIRKLIERGLER